MFRMVFGLHGFIYNYRPIHEVQIPFGKLGALILQGKKYLRTKIHVFAADHVHTDEASFTTPSPKRLDLFSEK